MKKIDLIYYAKNDEKLPVFDDAPNTLNLEVILDITSEETGISKEDIMGRCRKTPIKIARQIYMAIGMKYFKHLYTPSDIATFINKNRSTAYHAEKYFERICEQKDVKSKSEIKLFKKVWRCIN